MAVLGMILTWSLFGAYEGYSRTARNMSILEAELGLGSFTNNHPSHSVPYFLLMLFGIGCCFIAFLHYTNLPLEKSEKVDKTYCKQ